MDVEELYAEAMKLAISQRRRLAEALITSLGQTEAPSGEKNWLLEADERFLAYQEGVHAVKSAEQVFQDIMEKLS